MKTITLANPSEPAEAPFFLEIDDEAEALRLLDWTGVTVFEAEYPRALARKLYGALEYLATVDDYPKVQWVAHSPSGEKTPPVDEVQIWAAELVNRLQHAGFPNASTRRIQAGDWMVCFTRSGGRGTFRRWTDFGKKDFGKVETSYRFQGEEILCTETTVETLLETSGAADGNS